MSTPDWHLQHDGRGDVLLISDTYRINLGPRDEAFTRFADFMGEDFVEREWVAPPSLGDAGENKKSGAEAPPVTPSR